MFGQPWRTPEEALLMEKTSQPLVGAGSKAPDPAYTINSRTATSTGSRGLYPVVKRWVDVFIAVTVLVSLAPLLALIAVLIRVYSPGPVLYAQERVGYDPELGVPKPFKMYKFRTMHYNADPGRHREHMARVIRNRVTPRSSDDSLKIKCDDRVTGVGRILRKSSLDELPQLINVLKGDMSVVGPRPALPYEVEFYKEWHKDRLLAIPGLTGLWQVKARNRVSFDEMVRMDIYYVQHMSFGLDMKILLQTPVAVVRDIFGAGAG